MAIIHTFSLWMASPGLTRKRAALPATVATSGLAHRRQLTMSAFNQPQIMTNRSPAGEPSVWLHGQKTVAVAQRPVRTACRSVSDVRHTWRNSAALNHPQFLANNLYEKPVYSMPFDRGSGVSCSRTQVPPSQLPEVATVTVARQPVLLTTELPGRTSPYRIAEIRPQVNGLIQKRLFTEGADVQAGQELYQIDPAPSKRRSTMPRLIYLLSG